MDNAEKTGKENVILFPNSNWALFNDNIKNRLKTEVVRHASVNQEVADQAVNGVESALCRELIISARKFFSRLGESVARKIFE